MCGQSGLENHPVTARTYIHLGIVTFTGFKQQDEAIKQFRKALEIQADIKLDKILATPEVQEVYDEAVAQQKGSRGHAEEAARPEAAGEGIDHEPVTGSHGRGTRIPIKANVDPSLGAKKVVLSFSADGADDFAEREMKEDLAVGGGTSPRFRPPRRWAAVVDYFIEALADGETPVAAKGSANKTLKITMLNAERAAAGSVDGEEEAAEEGAGAGRESPSLFYRAELRQRREAGRPGTARIFGGESVDPPGFVDVPAAAPRARSLATTSAPSCCCRCSFACS